MIFQLLNTAKIKKMMVKFYFCLSYIVAGFLQNYWQILV